MQVVSTNTFGVAKWVVSPTPSQGTHTTIGAAIASASAGDTIWIRDGTYTENITLKNQVNIISFSGEFGGDIGFNVVLIGKVTINTNVSALISGMGFMSNNDTIISVSSGLTSGVLTLDNCTFLCSNGNGIDIESALYSITVNNCSSDITSLSNTFFINKGTLVLDNCFINNSVGSTQPSTNSNVVDIYESNIQLNLTTTGSGFYNIFNSQINYFTGTGLTTAGTGSSFLFGVYFTGTGSAINIGSSTQVAVSNCTISSSQTNVITGAGTLVVGSIDFLNSTGINVSTVTAQTSEFGNILAPQITFGTGTALTQYVEGTWTPTLLGLSTSGTTTYTIQTGNYTRIGNTVNITGTIQITAATGTGTALIGGLPFTIKSGTNPRGAILFSSSTWTWPALSTMLVLNGTATTKNCNISSVGSGIAIQNMAMNNSAAVITFSMTYLV